MARRFFLIVLTMVFVANALAMETPLRVLLTDYPPHIDLSKHDKGPHGRLVLGALDAIGQSYTIEEYSWSRIEKMLNEAKVCSFGWIKTPKRMLRWRYSAPYYIETSYLYGRKDNPLKLTRLEDVKAYRVGVTRSYSYGHALDMILNTMETDESNTDEANIRKLLAGRIDLYATDQGVMDGIIALFFPDSKGVLEPKLKVGDIGHHVVCGQQYTLGARVIEDLNKHFQP